MPLPRRLSRLPRATVAGVSASVAASWCSRLLGLAWLRASSAGDAALWLPRCRSIHTFGMRFALDLVWVDAEGAVLRVDRGVRPARVRSCRGAAGVLERRSPAR